MKKLNVCLIATAFFSQNLLAQNTGVGTASPTEKLEVKNPVKSVVKISTSNYIDTSQLMLSNRNAGNLGTDFMITARQESGIFISSKSDLAGNTNDSMLAVRTNGNVGIGTLNPAEKLDVTGNINLTGSIKANGVDGTANQVLMKNSSGSLAWGDAGEFKNYVTFIAGSGNWMVPAGVTKIMVECWGGGGGGIIYCGGGGGGYITALIDVTPGNQVGYIVGGGGNGSGSTGTNGGTTNLTYSPGAITLTAVGGFGATYTTPGNYIQSYGGNAYSAGTNKYFTIYGQPGMAINNDFYQSGTTLFFEKCYGANGGNAGNTIATGGNGAYAILNVSTATLIRDKFVDSGNEPGGGGGGGYIMINAGAGFANGGNGSTGRVVIHY